MESLGVAYTVLFPNAIRIEMGITHYYPVMLKPDAYNVAGYDHDNVLLSDLRWY